MTRVLSALLLAPPFLYCVVTGGVWFLVLMTALSLIGLKEYFDLLENAGRRSQRLLGYGWTAGSFLAAHVWGPEGLLAVVALVPNLFILKYLSTPDIGEALSESCHTFHGVLAYSVPLAFLVLLRNLAPSGLSHLVVLLVLVWVQDTAAYFWGLALGRHKLQPHLSPKKTWEGAILGLATALLAVWAACSYWLVQPLSGRALGLLVATAVSAQLGDLNESLLKRNVAAKDSGTLIPGHGGVLDRFDSFTFAAPVMYYVVRTTF
ncbi:MAG: phosphatidate cytidylyltransferase [Candidatus Riflebacteria bacterium]|nr:phosphatidate cytidylyltransferase [Candidatus Riflebacteria bacterium]